MPAPDRAFYDSFAATIDSSLAADLLRVGREAARRTGLRAEDVEDCAAAFAADVCELHVTGRMDRVRDMAAWLHACAHHFSSNYLRAGQVRLFHETVPIPRAGEAMALFWDIADDESGPEAVTLAREFGDRLSQALAQLSVADQVLFHHAMGRTTAEIVTILHLQPGAVRKRLERCRARLGAVLLLDGMDEAEAWEYVRLSAPVVPPGVTAWDAGEDEVDQLA